MNRPKCEISPAFAPVTNSWGWTPERPGNSDHESNPLLVKLSTARTVSETSAASQIIVPTMRDFREQVAHTPRPHRQVIRNKLSAPKQWVIEPGKDHSGNRSGSWYVMQS